MSFITLDNACLAFGHHALLDHVALQLDPGERVGLIGRNGGGKSSLLRALAGAIKLDDGRLWQAPNLRLAYVAQEPVLTPDHTVYQEVSVGLGHISQVLRDYHATSQVLSDAVENTEALLNRLQDLQSTLELEGGWNLQAKIETIIDKLKLPANTLIEHLSGGLKKRVALARALVIAPDVLLLDEPTNHLDFSSIEWLEGLLQEFSGSILFITHDRRFLDNISTRIVELDRGVLVSFPGNFSTYQTRKAEMLEMEAVVQRKADRLQAQEEVWIRKGVEARRTRSESRIRRLEQLRKDRAARREQQGQVQFNIDSGERSGKLVAELEHVSKAYGGKIIIRDFSTRIQRGDRIGLLGPNGAGKTTLLKLILGELQPDSGSVKQGTKLEIAYFDQFRTQLDENAAVIDVVSQGHEFIEIGQTRKHVISYLEDFLFAPERARSPVRSLSGGERNRLLLARLFALPANVLVLDEPTNDLDIDTLELLEELLQSYAGTVFLVSHDRRFLDNVVTSTIAWEGDESPGLWREYEGGYEEWRVQHERARALREARAVKPAPVVEKEKPAPPPAAASKPRKLSYKEQRELDELPGRIETLEAEQKALNELLADPSGYVKDAQRMTEAHKRVAEIDELLMGALERWEELGSR